MLLTFVARAVGAPAATLAAATCTARRSMVRNDMVGHEGRGARGTDLQKCTQKLSFGKGKGTRRPLMYVLHAVGSSGTWRFY